MQIAILEAKFVLYWKKQIVSKVYLDESLKRFKTVFPACGSSNSAIELTISELEKYSGFIAWVDVCKPKDS